MAKKRFKKPSNAKPVTSFTKEQEEEINKAFSMALGLHQEGKLQSAESLYKEIINIHPRHADAYHMLGAMAQQIGQAETACELIQQAIRINARVAQYHYNLAVCYQALGELTEAVSAYQRATRLEPNYLGAYENLAVVFRDLNNIDAAIETCKKALHINDDSLVANQNMGTLLYGRGQRDRALAHLNKVLSINPAFTEARWMKSLTLLSQGDYQYGWQEYEWRWFSDTFTKAHTPRVVPFPKWDGSPLAGKKILVNPEQGVGDEILFASCLPDLIQQAEQCVVECDPRLVRLFERSFPGATFMAVDRSQDFCWDSTMPLFDFRISAGSLPRFFRRSASDFPCRERYLIVDDSLKQNWRNTLSSLKNTINIGISWRGGQDAKQKNTRSIPLELWKDIFSLENINVINLQYGDHQEEIEAFNRQGTGCLHTLEGLDALENLDNFAALVSALDLVISIDNSTVHIAGAVGTPVWALLPCGPAWAWQHERDDCDWYASATLFRQDKPGNQSWRRLLKTASEELAEFLPTYLPSTDAESAPTKKNKPPQPLAEARTALLLNDTSFWYHWGCSCTSLAIHTQLRKKWDIVISLPIHQTNQLEGLPDTIDAFDDVTYFSQFSKRYPDIITPLKRADIVYINGEGTLHGVSAQSVGLLYLAWISKTQLGKQVHIINHSCYPEDNTVVGNTPAYQLYKKVYQAVDYVAVREVKSQAVISDMGVKAQPSFDCLPLFIDRYCHQQPKQKNNKIIIAGSVSWGANSIQALGEFVDKLSRNGYSPTLLIGANAHLAADDVRFVERLQKSCMENLKITLATSEIEWLNEIANAALLVSGRFHHSIAAAFLNTPFIVLESNTPKIEGVMEMFSLDTCASITDPHLANTLYRTMLKIMDNPADHLVNDAIKENLISLSKQNFRH